ncbi:MAG: ABC transporter substrate-binding protein [Treponema sp.]|nr:ABC transporter substrate-binding protein [Treponema sp.]
MKTKTFFKKIILSVLFVLGFSGLYAKDKSPKSVVALSKSVAQMWLLAGGDLAATTTDALELSGAQNAISVGTLTTASLEAIISVNPDFVILTLDIPLHKKLYGNLNTLGIKTYLVDVKKFGDYEKVLKDFTDLTGHKELYKKNVTDVKEKINQIVSESKLKEKATYVFLRVSGAKNKVLKDHFGNEIFLDLGLESIVKDDFSLDELGIEAIVSENPDYIFVVHQGSQKKAEEAFYKAYQSNPAWENLSAVKNGRVFMLPKELFNYKPNEKWAEAYQYLADHLSGK